VFTYKVRDDAGQALEFNNYMLPLEIGGHKYLFSGVRKSAATDYSYLRIPVDEEDNAETWFAIRRIFFDPARRGALTDRFAKRSLDGGDKAMRERLKTTADHTLTLFTVGGLDAVSDFIEKSVPEEERDKAGAAFIQILQGLTWDAWQMARADAKLPALKAGDEHTAFIRDALIALADSVRYGAPFYLQLHDFEQKQASILQATRSPGKPLVYLGSLLLTLGIFAMLYIRERRLFVLLKGDEALVAMTSNRKTIDLDEQFAQHREGLAAALGVKV